MAFDFGTLINQKYQVEQSLIYDDNMEMARAESFGDAISLGLTVGLTSGSAVVTQAAASIASIGKLVILSGTTADDGTYLIVGAVASTSYTLEDSAGAAFSATNSESGAWCGLYDAPSLEADLNFLRAKEKEINGTTNWFDAQPNYGNQDDTASNVSVNITHLKDAHNKFQNRAIPKISVGNAVAQGDLGTVISDTTPYADATRNTGLPTLDGTGTPDATNYRLTYVGILDATTKEPVTRTDGTVIWGRMVKGDAVGQGLAGSGEGTDVGVKFFMGTNDASASPFTWDISTYSELPTSVDLVYHYVDTIYDASRDNMLGLSNPSGWILGQEGGETADDVRDLQEFVGSSDNETSPILTNTGDFFPFSENNATGPSDASDTDLEELVNVLNNAIGDLNFSTKALTIINNGDTDDISDILEDLAEGLVDAHHAKYIYKNSSSAIVAETAISLPCSS